MQSFFMASQNDLDVGWAAAGQEQKKIAHDHLPTCIFPFQVVNIKPLLEKQKAR